MKLTLRSRLILLITAVLLSSAAVNWIVILPAYESSVIEERLQLLSRIQDQRLREADERFLRWAALIKAAGSQLSSRPDQMEAVFSQYVKLFPELNGLRVTNIAQGEYIEIQKKDADSLTFALNGLQAQPFGNDENLRFTWRFFEDKPGFIYIILFFQLNGQDFQLSGSFSDAMVKPALVDFQSIAELQVSLELPGQILTGTGSQQSSPSQTSLLTMRREIDEHQRSGITLISTMQTVPLTQTLVADREAIREPIRRLFLQTELIFVLMSVVLLAGSWIILRYLQRPVQYFLEDTEGWGDADFSKPVRFGSLPEFLRVSGALERIRGRLEHYQRINVEKMILEQEKNMLLMRFASEMVAMLDENGLFVFTNNRFTEFITGISPDQIPASFQALIALPGVQLTVRASDRRKLGSLQVFTDSMEIDIQSDAHEYVLGCEKVTILQPDGALQGTMLFLHDLTEDRNIDRMRNEMIQVIIHELRNPVTGVVGLTDLLISEELDKPTQQEFYRLIQRNGRIMLSLINRFLDISRLESNKITLKKDIFEFAGLVELTAGEFASQFQQKQLTLSVINPAEEILVEASADLIADAVRNIVSNAVKYGPPNREIVLEIGKNGNQAFFAVTDHGFGIPEEHLDKIFQKFYRVRDARIQEVGTGLGLPYVKEIAEKHGGTLKLVTNAESGCCFTFSIPLKKARIPETVNQA